MTAERFRLGPNSAVIDEAIDPVFGVHYVVYLAVRTGPHDPITVIGIRTAEDSRRAPGCGGAHSAQLPPELGEALPVGYLEKPLLSGYPGERLPSGGTALDDLWAVYGLVRSEMENVRVLRTDAEVVVARLVEIEAQHFDIPAGTKVYSAIIDGSSDSIQSVNADIDRI